MTDHKAEAEQFLHGAQSMFWEESTWPFIAAHHAAGQIHATLYLAEQQRIANLIAYAVNFTEQAEFEAIGTQAKKGLGL